MGVDVQVGASDEVLVPTDARDLLAVDAVCHHLPIQIEALPAESAQECIGIAGAETETDGVTRSHEGGGLLRCARHGHGARFCLVRHPRRTGSMVPSSIVPPSDNSQRISFSGSERPGPDVLSF